MKSVSNPASQRLHSYHPWSGYCRPAAHNVMEVNKSQINFMCQRLVGFAFANKSTEQCGMLVKRHLVFCDVGGCVSGG